MSLKAISNPEAVATLYDDPQILDKAFLHGLELSPNDPIVKLFIRLEAAPTRIPKRWGNSSRTILETQVVDVKHLHLSAWNPIQPTALKIARAEDGLISIVAQDGSLDITCGWIYVAQIHPL
jgi:hypothetical protein